MQINITNIFNIKINLPIIITISAFILIKCASVSAPPGGPKDRKPPKLLSSYPLQNTTNYKGNKIVFKFNERIDATKLKDNILINPNFNNEFEIESTGKKLSIIFKHPLEFKDEKKKIPYNGTYSVNFPDGIPDENEKNLLRNLYLSFSTGNTIDTIRLKGYTIDYYKKDTIQKVMVGLYENIDSITPLKHKPKYFTYSNDIGKYQITNILPNQYKIFAFNDVNKNLIYDSKKENINFISEPLNLTQNIDSLTLEMFHNDINKPRFLAVKNGTDIRITFDEGIYKYKLSSEKKLYHKQNDNGKEIIIFKTDLCEDSIPVKVFVEDSSFNDTTYQIQIVQSTPKKFTRYKNIVKSSTPDDKYAFTDSIPFKIETYEPILFEKDTSIVFIIDSLRFNYQKLNKHFNKDSSNTIFTNTYKINFRVKDFIQIVLKPKSIFNILKDTNERISLTFKKTEPVKKNEEEIFRANISLETTEPFFIYQLLDEKYTIKDVRYNEKKITYENLPQGIYHIRIIKDKNNNKRYDSGNYTRKTYPEPVYMFKKALKVKKNWDIEDTIIRF
ncbi:MAG: Ig-like domain-containing protein [Bacteroidota bacterium]|nr:Ig-like domain-containing protein [Bacteroidota bacterium]